MTTQATVIALRADIHGLQADMQRAVGIVDGGIGKLRSVASAATAVFGALGAALVVRGVARGVGEIADYADKLRDLSLATGASIEQLSFLDFAAGQSGTSVESLTTGVARLQRNLNDVAKGAGASASRALDDLGLSARELAQLDLVSQLSTLGDSLAALQNPTERAAVAQQLFGRGAKELLPLLTAGERGIAQLADRFIELNGVIGTDQANQFDSMNDSIGELKLSVRQLSLVFASELAPALTATFTGMADAIPRVSALLDDFVDQTQRRYLELVLATERFNLAISTGLDKIPGVDKSAAIAQTTEEIAALQAVIDKLDRDQEGRFDERIAARSALRVSLGAGGPLLGGIEGEGSGSAADKARQREAEALAKSEADRILQLERLLAAEEDVTEVAKIRFEIEKGAYQNFTQEGKDKLLQLADELDLYRDSAVAQEALRGIEQSRRADAEKARQAVAAERQATIEALRTPQEQYADEVRRLLDLGLDETNLQRGIDAARDSMQGALETAGETNDVMRDLGLTFESAFESAIVGGEAFSEVLAGLRDDLIRFGTREFITEPLLQGLSAAFSPDAGLGDALGSLFGSLFGNSRGGLYRVDGGGGAERPIAFTARAGEFVAVGTRMTSGGGGGVNIEIINNTGAAARQEDMGVIDGENRIRVIIGDMVDERLGSAGGARALQRGYGLMPRTVNR